MFGAIVVLKICQICNIAKHISWSIYEQLFVLMGRRGKGHRSFGGWQILMNWQISKSLNQEKWSWCVSVQFVLIGSFRID